jgi:tetratricopeptide (TPR) repeat protein
MHFRHLWSRALVAAALVWMVAATAGAQTGRVGGTVKDESGNPIKGATVTAENPSASPSSFTAITDDKGRFSIIGMRSGQWKFTATMQGYAPEAGSLNVQTIGSPNPPIIFTLKKGGGGGATGALAGANAKELQAELAAADQAFNSKQWDDAIQKYQAVLAKAPAITAINLQIGQTYRNKADDARRQDPKADVKPIYDQALASYEAVLKTDPNNDKAKIGIAMTNLEKGDLKAADDSLTAVAQAPGASREVFYSLGEVKFAKGETDEAAKWYQKAAEADPAWGKPLFKLGLVALNKGDKDGTVKAMEKVIAADPNSPEAAQAKAVIEQLKKS